MSHPSINAQRLVLVASALVSLLVLTPWASAASASRTAGPGHADWNDDYPFALHWRLAPANNAFSNAAVIEGSNGSVSGSPTMSAGASTAGAATVVNGNFETRTLSGWRVVDVGDGRWFNYTGTTSPRSDHTIDPPPEGNRAAVTDQFGPGRHILYRDVALEPNFDHMLSLILYYRNQNDAFHTPPHLRPFRGPNQQYRIDIMKPSAPVASVAPGDVLLKVYP